MGQQNHEKTVVSTRRAASLGIIVLAGMIAIATYGVLSSFDFIPSSNQANAEAVPAGANTADVVAPSEYPTNITIPTLGLSVKVANPVSSDAATLDSELLKGAVRYPGSGQLGEKGKNVVVFAHSSYLPVVHNLAYKAFDDIQKMKPGEKIYVTGGDRTYVYAVEGVYQANTTSGNIPLEVEGNKLTLITCDSFATKSDRYVVTAALVESYRSR